MRSSAAAELAPRGLPGPRRWGFGFGVDAEIVSAGCAGAEPNK